MSHSNYAPDDAAVHWMITPNFRDGTEMDHSHTELDEFRYQHRGYAKYADITRLFGWEAFTSHYHQESVDYMQGIDRDNPKYNFGLDSEQASWPDIRTLRLSRSASYDLTPFIHFWGIFPVNADALRSKMAAQNLSSSNQVRCLLVRYRSLIPTNNAAFNAFFEKIHPGRPNVVSDDARYGRGWYNVWRSKYDETHAQMTLTQLDLILYTYFGVDASKSCDGVAAGDGEVARPTSYSWLPAAEAAPSTTASESTTPGATGTTAVATGTTAGATGTTAGPSTGAPAAAVVFSGSISLSGTNVTKAHMETAVKATLVVHFDVDPSAVTDVVATESRRLQDSTRRLEDSWSISYILHTTTDMQAAVQTKTANLASDKASFTSTLSRKLTSAGATASGLQVHSIAVVLQSDVTTSTSSESAGSATSSATGLHVRVSSAKMIIGASICSAFTLSVISVVL